MGELPLAAVDRIIRKAGGDRVSEDAAAALSEVLEEKGIKIAQQANEFQKLFDVMGDITVDVKGPGLIAEIMRVRDQRKAA